MENRRWSMREGDLYRGRGRKFEAAYERMADLIRLPFTPPSLEVFEHEHRVLNSGTEALSPFALAENYVAKAREKGHARS